MPLDTYLANGEPHVPPIEAWPVINDFRDITCGKPVRQHPDTFCIWGCEECRILGLAFSTEFEKVPNEE